MGGSATERATEAVVPDVLTVWPERHMVIFPYMIAERSDARAFASEAIERTRTSEHRLCFFVAQRRADDDAPAEDALYRVGTICMLMAMKRLPDGGIKVLVQGLRRARMQRCWAENGCYSAHVELLDDGPITDAAAVGALLQSVRSNIERAQSLKTIDPTFASAAGGTDDPGRAADLVASVLNLGVAEAQPLLELDDSLQRLDRANQLLEAKYQIDRAARLQDQPRGQSS